MTDRPNLRALAAHCGISLSYVGYDGRPCRVEDATCEALLSAFGIDASSEELAQRALHALQSGSAGAPATAIAGVRVLPAGSPELRHVELPLPEGTRGPVRFRLELQLEDGELHTHEGEVEANTEVLTLPMPPRAELGFGYHTLRCELDGAVGPRSSTQDLIMVPRRCVQVSELVGARRALGLWTHLYTLRSGRNAGIGDLCDLHALCRWAAGLGLDFVGINPLHAVDNDQGEVSPYYPLSRSYRNPIYLDLPATVARVGSAEAASLLSGPALAELRALPRIDYARVSAEKRRVLEVAHRTFVERHRGKATELGKGYAEYRTREGRALLEFATFSALREHLLAQGPDRHDFRSWPEAYRDPRSAAVASFATDHAEAIDLQCYLQFELDEQFGTSQRGARGAGMAIGIYGDLAVGDAPFAADVWARPELYASGASIGAPPDAYSETGQQWGLTPLDPMAMRADRYRFFRGLLRRSFRHTGMLRIDHAMGLRRQFWVPEGKTAAHGAYVNYPEQDLLGILALESRRAHALVVGEDLGVVPEGFREQMEQSAILRSQVLYFERDDRSEFTSIRDYARGSLVTVSTHDLPPLAGFFAKRDLEIRRRAGNIADDASLARAASDRERAKAALVALLRREGLLPDSEAELAMPALAEAVHMLIAGGAPRLVGLALDDLTLETEALNTPAASLPEAPNWSRRSRMPLEELTTSAAVRDAIRWARARATDPED